jgi:hypothetical protein
MPEKNRLNLAIYQNLEAFADDLHLSPEQMSQWHKFVGLIDSLKTSKVYGVALKVEEEVVLVMPTFEFKYDLNKLVKASDSGLLKTATMLAPSSHSTPLLLGWPLVFNDQGDPFLRPMELDQKVRGWEIVFGTLTSLSRMGTPELIAVANLSDQVVKSLPHKDTFEFGSVPTTAFMAGVPKSETLAPTAQGTTLFKHQLRLLNNPLKRSFRVPVATT